MSSTTQLKDAPPTPETGSPAVEIGSESTNVTATHPFIHDLPLPYSRSKKNRIKISPSHDAAFLPPNTPLIPKLASDSLAANLLGPTPAPPIDFTGACHARFYYRRHVFFPGARNVTEDGATHTFTTALPQLPPVTFRSRGSKVTVPQGITTCLTYPFALSAPSAGTDASFYPTFIEHLNQGWSTAFALYLGLPYEFANTGSPMLPLAALMEHQARPYFDQLGRINDAKGRRLFVPNWSAGTSDAAIMIRHGGAMPLGNPSGRATLGACPAVSQFVADHYFGLSPGFGYIFHEMRQTAVFGRPTEESGLNGTHAGGHNYRTLRTHKQIHYFLAPSQFYCKGNPRPLEFDEGTLKHLLLPLVPGMASNFFARPFTDNDIWLEAAKHGGLVQEIREAVRLRGGNEIEALELAWQAYYRMLLGFFYHFGGDFTYLDGDPEWTKEAAQKRRETDPNNAHGASCVYINAVTRLCESLRELSNWYVEAGGKEVPFESQLIGGIKLAHPFAFHDDEHFLSVDPGRARFYMSGLRGDVVFASRRDLLSTFLPRGRMRPIYKVVRKTIIHRKPHDYELAAVPPPGVSCEEHALKEGLAYDAQSLDIYRRHRETVEFDYDTRYRKYLKHNLIRVRALGSFVTEGTGAFLLKAGSNAVVTDDARVGTGPAFDYGADEITTLAMSHYDDWLGFKVDQKKDLPGRIAQLPPDEKAAALHSRGDDYAFVDGAWQKKFPWFAEAYPNFVPPVRGKIFGQFDGRYFLVPTDQPVERLEMTATYDIMGVVKMWMLVRMRMLSWGEYLNDSIHAYNKMRACGMPSTQVYDGEEFDRQPLWPFAKRDEFAKSLGVLDPEFLFAAFNEEAATRKLVAEIAELKAEVEEARTERSKLGMPRPKQYYNLSMVISSRNKKIAALTAECQRIRDEDCNIDKALALTVGLSLLNEPSNLRDSNGRGLRYMSDKDLEYRKAKDKYQYRPWARINPTDRDRAGIVTRKSNIMRDLALDLSPIPSGMPPEEEDKLLKAIEAGTYYSIENVSTLGARDVVFDRSFPALEHEPWAQSLRDALEDRESVLYLHSSTSQTRGDSYQFALARAAYMYLVALDYKLECDIQERLDQVFARDFQAAVRATVKKQAAYGDAVPASLAHALVTAHDIYSLCGYSTMLEDYRNACERFKTDHRLIYDSIKDRIMARASESVAIREQYRAELRAASIGVPTMDIIDRVANSQNSLMESAAETYTDNYREVASTIDVLNVADRCMAAHHGTSYVLWKTVSNAITPVASPVLGLEEGVSAAVNQSKQVDNELQPVVFHYARVLNDKIAIGDARASLSLIERAARVDKMLAFVTRKNSVSEDAHDEGGFERLARILSTKLATLAVMEDPLMFDDDEKCLLATKFAVAYQDTDDARSEGLPPKIMSDWQLRMAARDTALDVVLNRKKGLINKLDRVKSGSLISPHAFVRRFIPPDVVARILKGLEMAGDTIKRDDYWPVDDGVITPTRLRMERRQTIGDLMMELGQYTHKHKEMRSIAPTPPVTPVGISTISATVNPWWWAAAAHAFKRYYERESRVFTLPHDTLAMDGPEMYEARNPNEAGGEV